MAFERTKPPNLVLRTLATSNTLTMTSVSYGGYSSPVTNLTLNLSELNTGRATPRRKLSMSCLDTPTSCIKPSPERSISTESGCFVDTPSPIDSPTFELCSQKFCSSSHVSGEPEAINKQKMSFRRFNSMPLPMLRMSPTDMETGVPTIATQSTPLATLGTGTCITSATKTMDTSEETVTDVSSDLHTSGSSSVSSEDSLKKKVAFYIEENSSQDSGFECDKDSRDAKDLDDGFEFVAPKGIPPSFRRHSKIISEDTCSPFKYSPVKDCSPSKRRNSCPVGSLDFSGEIVSHVVDNSPESPLKMCSLTSMDEGIHDDDGFLDIVDEEVAKLTTSRVSSAMSSLFIAPLVNQQDHISNADEDDTPVTRRVMSRRNLCRSQSMNVRSLDERLKRDHMEESPMQFTFKRNKPQDESTPRQEQKRMRPSSSLDSPVAATSKPVLHRCHSESEAMIKSALNRQADEPDLIGDCSKTYCLPTLTGKHQDLKSISGETLSRVIAGDFSHIVEKAYIIDCRYPYEYQGGHVQGAENIYTNEGIIDSFMKNPIKASDPNKRVILIFHCEFSSERAPRLSRFLRRQDRLTNTECYPHLYYPELYLLEGGYKSFFESEKENCVPQTYKPMLHPDHNDDLRRFRTKSKSWAGEQRGSRSGFRPLKF